MLSVSRIASMLLFMLVTAGTMRGAGLPAANDLGRLSIYNGTWALDTITGKHRESVRTVIVTSCWRSHAYYVCSQSAKGTAATLIVYTTSAGAGDLYAYFITQDARHSATGMDLKLRDNVWTYSARLRDTTGKRVSYRDINRVRGPDSIDFREDYSRNGKQWILISRGHESRLH